MYKKELARYNQDIMGAIIMQTKEMATTRHVTGTGHHPYGPSLDPRGEVRARTAEEHLALDNGSRAEHTSGSIKKLTQGRWE